MPSQKFPVGFQAIPLAFLVFTACSLDFNSGPPEEAKSAGPAAVLLHLGGSLPTFRESGGLLPSVARSQYALEKLIDRAARDLQVQELVAQLGGAEVSLARAMELARALKRFAASGKPVTCHIDYADNLTYWLAVNGCSRILLSPAGGVEALGISLEAVFFKELLTSVGVEADFLSVGKYKNASEPFTRDGMSPDSKKAAENLIGQLHQRFVSAIAAGRKLEKKQVQAIIDSGPYDAKKSAELGLVDEVSHLGSYLSDLRDKYAAGVIYDYGKPKPKPFSVTDLFKLVSKSGDADQEPSKPHISIVPIIGPINSGVDEGIFGDMEMVRDGELVRALGELQRDDSVRAVVLRIDSPGGSPLASDNIWQAVRSLREKKPVIASLGDVAASGGYYIAAGASEILASATTLTGSIGVVGGKIVVSDAASKLGIKTERVSFSKRAGLSSPFALWSGEERAAFRSLMESTYKMFIDRVVEGRGMDRDKVLSVAEGRVWTGAQAKELGLVDLEGGLDEAVNRARQLAGLPKGTPVEIFPPPKNLMELLGEAFTEPEEAVIGNFVKRHRALSHAWAVVELMKVHSVLAISPVLFEIR